MKRRIPLRALIVLELDRGMATVEELQSAVTLAKIREGFSWHAIKLLIRSPITILRIFKPVSESRIRNKLAELIQQRIVDHYPEYNSYGLSYDEGYRSVSFWQKAIARGAFD